MYTKLEKVIVDAFLGEKMSVNFSKLDEFGYIKLDWKFDRDWCKEAISVLSRKKDLAEHKALIPNMFFDTAVFHQKILFTVEKLFGASFLFHHANGYAHSFSDPYKKLHHDYDQVLSSDDDRLSMVHFMIYPAGIDDDCGNLTVVPGSHLAEARRNLTDSQEMDRLQRDQLHCDPGEVFLVYSSLWHGRGEMRDPGRVRYHMNFSYCRRLGPRKELLEWKDRHEYLRTVLPQGLHQYLQ